jgi:hypothetical protein
VSHYGLAILQFKKYLKKARRRIMEKSKYIYFTMQKYNLPKPIKKLKKKKPLKETKILPDII